MSEETSFQRTIREFRESEFVNFQKFLDHREKERELCREGCESSDDMEKELDSEKEV